MGEKTVTIFKEEVKQLAKLLKNEMLVHIKVVASSYDKTNFYLQSCSRKEKLQAI